VLLYKIRLRASTDFFLHSSDEFIRIIKHRFVFVDEATLEIDARKACAKSVDGDDIIMNQFCINDVMATGDLDLAEDPFYRASSPATTGQE
jgi:hypothetical protein